MREKNHFEYLRETVLPYWVKNITDRDFRIWSAGCSSGEEACTLAMILDVFSERKSYGGIRRYLQQIYRIRY